MQAIELSGSSDQSGRPQIVEKENKGEEEENILFHIIL